MKLSNYAETNIWVCFGLDAFAIVLCLVAMSVLTTTLYVIDRFYNSNYKIRRKVCRYRKGSQNMTCLYLSPYRCFNGIFQFHLLSFRLTVVFWVATGERVAREVANYYSLNVNSLVGWLTVHLTTSVVIADCRRRFVTI